MKCALKNASVFLIPSVFTVIDRAKKKRGGGYDLFKWDGSKSPLVIDSAFVIKQHTYPRWQLETWKLLTLEQQTQTIKPTKHIDP